jgi:CHAT domain-containing protein/Tfp pilus assembly protein PilF
MPITWLNKNRSALALSFFFPWFPPVPVSPPAETPAVVVEAAVPAAEEPLVLPGVVIEEIPKGSALEKAGLQVGDVILSWERLPNPPANPEGARGKIESPFDWMWLEIEQAPRGIVRLKGERDRKAMGWEVRIERWGGKLLPRLSPQALARLLSPMDTTANSYPKAVAQGWKLLSAERQDLRGKIACWRLVRYEANFASLDKREVGDFGCPVAENTADAALALTSAAQIFELGRRNDLARFAAQAALRIAEALPNAKLLIASIQSRLCRLSFQADSSREALKMCSSALSLRRAVVPGSFIYASSLNDTGVLLRRHGELDEAERFFREALAIQTQISPMSTAIANTFNNLGLLLMDRRSFGAARQMIGEALSIRRVLEADDLQLARSIRALGLILSEEGELQKAEQHFREALELMQGYPQEASLISSILRSLASVRRELGDYVEAYELLLEASNLPEISAGQGVEMASILSALGILSQDIGETSAAISHFERALSIRKRIAPESRSIADDLRNLGNISFVRGDIDAAKNFFNEALRLAERDPSDLTRVDSLNSLGLVALAERDYALSEQLLRSALRLGEELRVEKMRVSHTLSYLGDVHLAQGDLPQAAIRYKEALNLRKGAAPATWWVAESLVQIANVLERQGRIREAASQLVSASQILRRQANLVSSSPIERISFRVNKGEAYLKGVKLLLRLDEVEAAFSLGEEYRAQEFLNDLASGLSVRSSDGIFSGSTEDILAGKEFGRGHSLGGPGVEYSPSADDPVSVVKEGGAKVPELALGANSLQLDALDSGTLILSYLSGEEESYLFALSPTQNVFAHVIPISRGRLRQQIDRLRELIPVARPGTPRGDFQIIELRRLSRELYNLLIAPAVDRIEKADRILIIADGPLHYLPFSVLVREVSNEGRHSDDQYLAEWRPFHFVLSATVYAEVKKNRRDPAKPQTGGSLLLSAFGDPLFPSSLKGTVPERIADIRVRSAVRRGILEFEPLPATRREVEGIAALFPPDKVAVFLGAEATEERVKAVGKSARILHFATHARLDERFPLSSSLILSIPEGFPEDRDNGLLQVWEIFERVRLDADLVVLSACDTGLGKELGGEGLIGLTRAFQYAGARTVMASLWSIQDQATSELMIRFYKHLRAGLPKDEALRQAQMELIRGPIEVVNEKGEKTLFDASAPYYWAGIQVYGDWQ